MPDEEEPPTEPTPEPWEALKAYLKVLGTGEDQFIRSTWDEASRLVRIYVLGAKAAADSETPFPATMPVDIIRRATLGCGSELYHQRDAPSGISEFTGADGAPVRVARDPMVAARPLLDPFMPPGFS